MNKQIKQHLEKMVESLVEQDSAVGKEAFHEYLRLKSQAILFGESTESEEDDDKGDDEDDEKDDDKGDDEDDEKDDKKSSKKSKKKDDDCDM